MNRKGADRHGSVSADAHHESILNFLIYHGEQDPLLNFVAVFFEVFMTGTNINLGQNRAHERLDSLQSK